MYFLLYKTMYNENKHFFIHENVCFHYTRRCIMKTNISLYMKVYFSLYKKMYFLLYKMIYNDNKHFFIHENVFLIIQENVLLYKMIYNDNKHFIIHETCISHYIGKCISHYTR